MMRLWPAPATARFSAGVVGFFFNPSSGRDKDNLEPLLGKVCDDFY